MIALIVIGIIIAVIAVILIIPIKLSIYGCYNEGASGEFELKYGFIRINIPEGKEKKPEQEAEQPQSMEEPAQKQKKTDIIAFLHQNSGKVKKLIYDALNYIFRHFIRIRSIKLRMVIGVEDAMQTALVFGAVSSFVFNAVGAADKLMRIDDHSINVKPAFDDPHIFAEIDTVLCTNLFRAAVLLAIVLRRGLPIYINYRKTNERNGY